MSNTTLGANIQQYKNQDGVIDSICQRSLPIHRQLEAPLAIELGSKNPKLALGNSFVYQYCPLYVRGQTTGSMSLKVELFAGGMYLGEFAVDLKANNPIWIALHLSSGNGLLEFYFRPAPGTEDHGFWIDWTLDMWGRLFSDKVKLVSPPSE